MTRDFAKPSTTKTPGGRPNKRPPSSRKKSSAIPKKQPNKPHKQENKKPNLWVIFLCIIVVSGFITAIYFLNKVPPAKIVVTGGAQKAPKEVATPAKAPVKEEAKERFKFYDLLPESEVIPPKVDAYHYKEKGAATKYEYLLQTGSFRNHSDAERQRAMIGLQGLKARVKKVESADKTIWYRVQVGPFTSRSKMNGAMDRLVAIHIQPLVKKNKR